MDTVVETWKSLSRWNNYVGTRYGEKQEHVAHGCHEIRDGVLTITARKKPDGWKSAALFTNDSVVIPPRGKLTVEVNAPWEQGFLPAVWMIGARYRPDSKVKEETWPYCGEVDLLEAPGGITAEPLLHGNLHGAGVDGGHWQRPARRRLRPGQWMTVGLDMTRQGQAKWLVDGEEAGLWTRADTPMDSVWPFRSPGMRIVLSLAVGGWKGIPEPRPDVEKVSMSIRRITWTSA